MNSSAHKNDHVLDLSMDYLEGRLDPDQTDEVRQHLRQCDDCRADFDHASMLRGRAIETGARHIHSLRLVELSDGAHASVEENAHLDACGDCQEQMTWASDLEFPAEVAEEATVEETAPQSAPGWGQVLALPRIFQLSGVFGAAAVLLLILQPWAGNNAMVELAEYRALPVVAPGTIRGVDDLEQGTKAYAAGDYATARERLANVDTDHLNYAEAQLYLGSTFLLEGDLQTGRAHLLTAIDAYDPEEVDGLAAAYYLLGNTYLADSDGDQARVALERSVELDGIFSDEARAKLQALDAVE